MAGPTIEIKHVGDADHPATGDTARVQTSTLEVWEARGWETVPGTGLDANGSPEPAPAKKAAAAAKES